MSTRQLALDFVADRGRSLAGINPGSIEYALQVDDAIQAARLFWQAGIPISGGDILSEIDGNLIYAYQLWGDEYIYLSCIVDKRKVRPMKSIVGGALKLRGRQSY